MKKLFTLIIFFSAAVCSVSAQKFQKKLGYKPKDEEWADSPRIHPVPPEYANEHAIILYQSKSLDFRYEGYNSTNMYYTLHRIVKVLDHAGIEMFNTIEIPHWFAKRIPLIKARTILPNGKIKEIAKDMILTTEDGSGNYKVIIAMEGVEKNAEIELLVKEITPASYFGTCTFESDLPILQSTFEMSYPRDLSFQTKSYNGLPEAKEYYADNRKHLKVTVSNVHALRPEPYSFYELHRMRLEYRLSDFASDMDKTQEYTWDSLAKAIHNVNYNLTEKERRAVNGFLSELGVAYYDDEFVKVKKIENGIKTKVTLYAAVDYDERKEVYATHNFRSMSLFANDYYDKKDILDTIISKKSATGSGYLKLFAACLTQAGVRHELGLAVNHEDYMLDKAFPNFNEMDYPLFYFPGLKKYLSPLDIYLRMPFVPQEAAGSMGVFSTIPPNQRKGDVNTGFYKIRTVTPLATGETQTNVSANVTFTKNMDAQMDIAYSYSGYDATDIRTQLALLKDKKLEDYINGLIKAADKNEDVVKYTISNEGFDKYYHNKPLELYASVTTSRLTGKAGPKYIFNVGGLIGHQAELYSENKRRMPVDLAYPHSATHRITINIPKGYKVTNLESLKMNEDFLNNDIEPVMGFSSDYKVEDDKLIITVNEYYSQLHFPVADYDRFRKVMNTAADFSKVKVVLEKGKMKMSTKPKERRKAMA